MSSTKSIPCLAALAWCFCNIGASAAEVQFDLTIERGAPITAGHEWMKTLSALPVGGVRISNNAVADPSIEGSTGTLKVHGIITRGNELIVPGRSFARSEKSSLKKWIEDLREGKLNSSRDFAFGMTAEELVEMHEHLSVAIRAPTREQDARSVVQQISRQISPKVRLPTTAKDRFDQADNVQDELEGVSCGTALAAVLRPLGLVYAPRRSGDQWELLVADSRDVEESWPIGWPAQQKAHDLSPKLMEFLTVEINGVTLEESLAAVREKTRLPTLFDHNGMARQRIEPAEIRVSIPAGRTFYKKLLRQILFQAKLKSELRLDEADEPFLWISPIKKSN